MSRRNSQPQLRIEDSLKKMGQLRLREKGKGDVTGRERERAIVGVIEVRGMHKGQRMGRMLLLRLRRTRHQRQKVSKPL